MTDWSWAPRDVEAASTTLLIVTVIALLTTSAWGVLALVTARASVTPTSAAVTVAGMGAAVALSWVVHRHPRRVPVVLYPTVAVASLLLIVTVSVITRDATASGLFPLVYVVVFAAAHFRAAFAWLITSGALLGTGFVVFWLRPTLEAAADALVAGSALCMLTHVLLTLGRHQDDLVRRLNHLAAADALTGLATRRELDSAARRLWGGRATRPGGRPERRRRQPGDAVGLVLIDLDRFKDLNDTYGHPVGDAALVHVAGLVRGLVREGDTVARLGGDELAVLQAGAPDDVVERARQIHDAIRSTPLHLDRRTIAMTASIGVAHGRTGEVDLDGLYAAADRALYRAKDDGRDGLRVASDAEVAPLRS